MSSEIGAEDRNDVVDRLSQLGCRSSIMAIDATLRALSNDGIGFGPAATEVRGIARRVLRTTRDLAASLPEAR